MYFWFIMCAGLPRQWKEYKLYIFEQRPEHIKTAIRYIIWFRCLLCHHKQCEALKHFGEFGGVSYFPCPCTHSHERLRIGPWKGWNASAPVSSIPEDFRANILTSRKNPSEKRRLWLVFSLLEMMLCFMIFEYWISRYFFHPLREMEK